MRPLLFALALFALPAFGRAAEPAKAPLPVKAARAFAPFADPSAWTPEQLAEAHLQARVAKARLCAQAKDVLGWGKAVMPDKFYKPFCAELHRYFVEIRHAEISSTVAPRNHAKTLVKCVLIPMFQALEEPASYDYYLNVQATNKKGVAVNFAIKHEMENNPVIRRLYGDQVGDVKWTDELFMLRNGVVFQGAGAGDSIRGMQFLSKRPKYTVIDDLYDEEDIDNPDRIKAKNDWYWSSLYPVREKGKNTSYQTQGTAIGANDIMAKLGEMALTDKAILHREFAAYDEKTGKILWPELNSKEQLQKDRERMGSVIFDRELQGKRRNTADSIVKEHWLAGWEYDPVKKWGSLARDFGPTSQIRVVETTLNCDPSTGKDEGEGDPAAFAVIIETHGPGSRKDWWIEAIAEEYLSFDGRLAKLEAMKAQHEARLPDPAFRIRRVRVESIGGFLDFGNQAKAKTGLPIVLVTWVKGKLANLAAKSGHFEFGRVHVSSSISKPLRDKLLDQLLVNEPVHDDVRDTILMGLEDPTSPPMKAWVG